MQEESSKSLNNEFKENEITKANESMTYRNFKFKNFFKDVSYGEFVKFMYQPKDPSSLGIIRFLFGKY